MRAAAKSRDLSDAIDRAERAERGERDLRDTSRAALARVAELERERDAALIERDEAQHTFRCVEEDERYQDRVSERDAARRELAELALEVGYGERPEGQDCIIHPDGKTLAGAWLLERKGRDEAEAERDAARATIAELVTALTDALGWAECDAKSLAAIEARKRWPDHLPTGFETRVDRLRAALAKGAANG